MSSALLKPETDLPGLFRKLDSAYGPQNWWPATERFEILIGAILVQNTAWANVIPAISKLREFGWLNADAILKADEHALQEVLRPSGSFRVKARRLLNLCEWYADNGGFAALDGRGTSELRQSLLSVNGVGDETADAILLYGFQRPVFVIDAYTRRLLARLGWIMKKLPYADLRTVFELTLPADSDLFGQYHALIVEHAKRYCRARPLCEDCILNEQCEMALRNTA